MSVLGQELDRYLSIRRSLGYDLRTSAWVLLKFIVFAEQEGADHITVNLFLKWRDTFGHASRATWAARLQIIRLFAQWVHGIDPRHEVPPQGLIPGSYRRSRPYIYSHEEIRRIIRGAAELPSIYGIRGLTYANLFGLISVTGMRVSEAISLDIRDVDMESGVLTIRRSKFGKTRLLPLSDSTKAQLAVYVEKCRRLLGGTTEVFFRSERGGRLTAGGVRYNFAVVCKSIGLRPLQRFHRNGCGPRIHDLRHTFAVHTLLKWYRTNKDVACEMLKLTTYLGHSIPAHTYWYIEAVPELLELALKRSCASLAREVRV